MFVFFYRFSIEHLRDLSKFVPIEILEFPEHKNHQKYILAFLKMTKIENLRNEKIRPETFAKFEK